MAAAPAGYGFRDTLAIPSGLSAEQDQKTPWGNTENDVKQMPKLSIKCCKTLTHTLACTHIHRTSNTRKAMCSSRITSRKDFIALPKTPRQPNWDKQKGIRFHFLYCICMLVLFTTKTRPEHYTKNKTRVRLQRHARQPQVKYPFYKMQYLLFPKSFFNT